MLSLRAQSVLSFEATLGDPELRRSEPAHLEGDQIASTVRKQFNFEGSTMELVERFFRAFGGEPVA